MWPGSAPAETWDFPIASAGGLEPSIAVMSAGDDGIVVTVDIVTEDGVILNAREISIDSNAPALIPLSDLAAAPFGVRVRATAPVAASVLAVVPAEDTEGGEGGEAPPEETTSTTTADASTTTAATEESFVRGLAGTIGSSHPSSEWILPLDTLPGSETTVWIMNSGTEPARAQVGPIGDVDYEDFVSVEVPAESILGIPVDVGIGIYGYTVNADRPVSVAWAIAGNRGVALASGVHSG